MNQEGGSLDALAREAAFSLLAEVAGMFTWSPTGEVTEASRIAATATTVDRMARLLAFGAPANAASEWLASRVEAVRGYLSDYATICAADDEQAGWWDGHMFEVVPRPGQRSRWETLTGIVDAWRRSRHQARREHAATRATQAGADRAELERNLETLRLRVRHGLTAFELSLIDEGRWPGAIPDFGAQLAAVQAAQEAAGEGGEAFTLDTFRAALASVPGLSLEEHRRRVGGERATR